MLVPEEIISDDGSESDIEKNEKLRSKLRKWAVEFKINHTALKSLMQIINTSDWDKSSDVLPNDPRTLLQTPQFVNIMPCQCATENIGITASKKL